ncbi:MAG: hypothetical protein KF855_06875 [Acidobacteria bacterium]|nr:hypothetical protein [Acidobacteriota bacterium]
MPIFNHIRTVRSAVIAAAFVMLFVIPAAAQETTTFSDPNVEYSFEVPDARWKMTAKPTATNANVEYVYVDRRDAHLEVRKISVASSVPMADVLRDEEQKLKFMPGYVAGKEESISGKLNGSVFNFEFVRAGRPMAGRFYFLRSGNSVYIMRFTGLRDKLRSVRHNADRMARTFAVS